MWNCTYDLPEVTRLTINLTVAQTEALDRIMRGDGSYRPDNRHRRMAIGDILLSHARELRHRIDREGSAERAQQALRDERDALRRELDAVAKALTVERETRRRDRERFASARRSLGKWVKSEGWYVGQIEEMPEAISHVVPLRTSLI